MQGNRFGLRGSEDLSGAWKALFVLENGFVVESGKLGQGGSEFGRQAFVGLSSDAYGKLTLGRQYDSVVDMVGALESGSQWAGYTGAHPGDLGNMNNRNRVNNAVKYTSPNFGGLPPPVVMLFDETAFVNLNPNSFAGTATFNNAEVNFKYQLTPMLLAGVAYQYTHGPSMPAGSGARCHQVNVGADYFLSKRTDVYLIGAWQHASGYDSTNTKAVAAINGVTPSNTQNQVVTTVGIRHKF